MIRERIKKDAPEESDPMTFPSKGVHVFQLPSFGQWLQGIFYSMFFLYFSMLNPCEVF